MRQRQLPALSTVSLHAALAAVLSAALVGVPPADAGEVTRIYIGNDDHTDYFWTGDDVDYRQSFLAMLDYYMDQAEATASNPSDARGRFNCDGSLWVWEYERNKPPSEVERLFDHLRDGTLSMPLHSLVLLYGAMPAEAVLRNMYYAGRLERRENLRFPLVAGIENQTLPAGVASLWAGSGAKYSWKGICGCATEVDWAPRPREIYHFTGPDGQSVLMKWNTMRDGNESVGGYAEARDPYDAVVYLDGHPGHLAAWPWPVSAAFGHGWDDLETFTDAFIQASLDLSTTDRRVIVSNEEDFFVDFEANHGGEIETFAGSFGNEWDLLTASMGEVNAAFRRAVERLRTAESMATLVALHDPAFTIGRETDRDDAFMACGLFYEHDWTANGPVGEAARAQFQRDMLADLETYVDDLRDDASVALGDLVSDGGSANERHLVWNPLSFERTDAVDLDVVTAPPFHVVDVTTGATLPHQAVTVDGQPRTRVLATDVPSLGYAVVEIVPGAGTDFPDAATGSLPSFENALYEVTLGSRGQITSLVEKIGDHEWVDGGLNDQGDGSGTAVVENTGPVSTTLLVDAGGSPAHETRVTLYHPAIPRIDVENRITENFDEKIELTYDFAVASPVVRHEEVGMVAVARRKADGGDYADENARLDYLTLGHFVDVSDVGTGIALSSWDSAYFRLGNSTTETLDASSSTIHAVVGMQVDGPSLGIDAQGGDTFFRNRFAILPHGFYANGPVMRFALAHQNPLVGVPVTGGSGVLPDDTMSLLRVPGQDAVVWALKPAEEGIDDGVIARVWNLSDAPSSVSLELVGLDAVSAMRSTHIETDLEPAALAGGVLSDSFARQEMRTYRIDVDGILDVDPSASPAPSAHQLAVSPLPAMSDDVVRIRFESRDATDPVTVRVYDAQGREVAELAHRVFGVGPHQVSWAPPPGRSLAPGLYFVEVEGPRTRVTGRVLRVE